MDSLLSPRRRLVLQGLGATMLASGCGLPARSGHQFGGPTMGSTYTVKIAGPRLGAADAKAARQAVEGAFAGVVDRMSSYCDDSELSRFNRYRGSAPFALSTDTFAVFRLARDVSAATGGAFDITVAPLVDAWGFGPGRAQRVVSEAEAAALETRVGWRMLALDERNVTVAKVREDVRADLSGIAKGYAVDLAAQALDRLGVVDYMVEAGGEIRTRGYNADGRPWQIAIERPDAVPQAVHRIVPLTGLAMATSGDYRIYFERDGERYCHEIDPATGRPIRHGLASVTVVATDCGYADAMATALIVLGPEHGYALAVARNVAALFITREGNGGLREFGTPAFSALGGRLATG
jgi:thiamine biosynthesis lipoprotein